MSKKRLSPTTPEFWDKRQRQKQSERLSALHRGKYTRDYPAFTPAWKKKHSARLNRLWKELGPEWLKERNLKIKAGWANRLRGTGNRRLK